MLGGKAYPPKPGRKIWRSAFLGDLPDSMCGDVAQMGERYVRNVQARGSIPLISTSNKSLKVHGKP